jgi:ABC-type transport system substrate-binding protein
LTTNYVRVAVLALIAMSSYGPARASTAPRYGGTLVVELHESSLALDPVKWKTGAPENSANMQIASAIFDRLLTLDRFGRFQPALATDWSHDAALRRWQFSLRPGVQFSDGTALTSVDVAAALQELLPPKTVVTPSGMHVVAQFPGAVPDFLEQLASGRNFIYRRAADGKLLGTGPFYIADSAAATPATLTARYKLVANERCWAGRPFVDAIDVVLAVPTLRQLFDLQLGKADIAEISPELVRRAAQENVRVWASAPLVLYAVQVNSDLAAAQKLGRNAATRAGSAKAQLGEALSLALDRATLANVLLQKQAEPAASFLPQWLSGYAFVFAVENNVGRAKEISVELFGAGGAFNVAPSAGSAQPLHFRVDAAGDLAKLIAERVAINARQAGIPVQIQTHGATAISDTSALRLVAWRYSSLSSRTELDAMAAALQLESPAADSASDDPEESYARERKLLSQRALLPLVVMPEYVGLSAAVRDWIPERWGAWHLADVWLDEQKTVPVESPAATSLGVSPAMPATTPATQPGAQP